MSELWSYAKSGVQKGPVDVEELRRLVSAGEVTGKDLAWRPGMANWAAIETVPELLPEAVTDLPVATAMPVANPPVVAYQGPAMDGFFCTARTIELYRQTRPWVRVVVVFMWIGVVFMMLGGIAMIAVASMGTGRGRGAVAIGPALAYMLFALLYIVPTIYLTRYASRISQLMRIRTPESLEQAVEAQKSFWKFVGIAFLVIVGIYIVAIAFIALAAALRLF